MAWQLVHHFVGSPCERGAVLRSGPGGRWRRRSGQCPFDEGSGVGPAIVEAVTGMLLGRGHDYPPVGENGKWLWCIGGPDVFRHPPPDQVEISPDVCVDLHVYACDRHRVVSVETEGFDLVAEWGGTSPADPRQSNPIDLGEDPTAAIAEAIARIEPWLDDIFHWPVQGSAAT